MQIIIPFCKNGFAALSLDDEESDLKVLNDETEKEIPKVGKEDGVNLNISMPT